MVFLHLFWCDAVDDDLGRINRVVAEGLEPS
jgi:hypothetical protein